MPVALRLPLNPASPLQPRDVDEAAGEDEHANRECNVQWVGLPLCLLLFVGGALAVALYGPTEVVRYVLLLFPKEPGWDWYVGLLLFIMIANVTLMPFWALLCMMAGLIFGLVPGALLNFAAIFGGAVLSITLGRCLLQEPIRQCMEQGDYPKMRRMMLVMEDSDNSLKFQVLFRFLFIPIFIRNYGPATLQIPLWKLFLGSVPHSLWISVLYASLGATFQDAAQLLLDGKDFDIKAMKWQQVLVVVVSVCLAGFLALYAHSKYTEQLEREEAREALAPELRAAGSGGASRGGAASQA